MKGKSHAQEEVERSVKSPGGNAELNIRLKCQAANGQSLLSVMIE